MRLVIIADIHDNLANLEKVLDWSRANQIDKIICLGDITTTETISYLAVNFNGEIFVVRGNCEIYQSAVFSQYPNLTDLGNGKNIKLGNLIIGCGHEPETINDLIRQSEEGLRAERPGAPNFVFYGHTHKPWLEKRGETTVVNPGNVAGVFHQATFAFFDTANHKLELKILADLK